MFTFASGDPGNPDRRDLLMLAALAMHSTAFLALLASGYSPESAIAATCALGVGAVEILRRLGDDSDGDGPSKPRSLR